MFAAIDRTLPSLAAFNEQFSNSGTSVTKGQQSVGGALSDIVSDVLHKNQSAGQGSTTAQNTFSTSNVVSVLRGLLSKNSTGTPASVPNQANAQAQTRN